VSQGHLYLITGGAGFIGSNIAEALVKRGDRVRVLDNFVTGRRENLEAVGRVELVEGDLRSPADCARAVAGVDGVFHQAALRSVPRSVDDPTSSNEVNISGTLNLLMACRAAKVRRVVYASSSSCYGDDPALPKVETLPTNPISPYAVSKLAAEHYCRTFARLYGLETVSLRYFNVFGPRQNPESIYSAVIPRFLEQALKHEPLEVTATASSRATSRTSTTSCRGTSARWRRQASRARCSTSPATSGRRSSTSRSRSASSSAGTLEPEARRVARAT
jgi:nucleoside-diphosphate-sugar epimerase